MSRRQDKLNSLLKNLAASFIKTDIDSKAMVTVTRTETSDDLRLAKIFISVYPENGEKEIIDSLKNKAHDFRNYLKSKIKMKFLPSIVFEIDRELKMERKIEEILKNK